MIKIGDISLDHFGFIFVDELKWEFKDFNQGKLGFWLIQEHGDDSNFLRKLKINNLIYREVFSIDAKTKVFIIGEIISQFKNQLYTKFSAI